MSWARDTLEALKRIILLEDRIRSLTEESQRLMDKCQDLDRRLIRMEAKFELLERMATPSRRALPEKYCRHAELHSWQRKALRSAQATAEVTAGVGVDSRADGGDLQYRCGDSARLSPIPRRART